MTQRLPPPDISRFPSLDSSHIRVLPAGHQVGRIYTLGGAHPSTWSTMRAYGPTKNRFDHQPPPARDHPTRRVLYGAPRGNGITRTPQDVLRTCLAEVFRDRGVIELSRDDPYFALFDLAAAVTLLDVVDGPWITRAGGNAAISSGPHAMARDWARAIWRTYADVDGLIYECSNIPTARSIVLFERAAPAVPRTPTFNRPLRDPSLRAAIENAASFMGLHLVP